MKSEEKDLLLQDLCARLPYKPKIQWDCADYDLLALENCEPILARIMDDRPYSYAISKPLEEIKPYLRPMSSMTDEEFSTLYSMCCEKAFQFREHPAYYSDFKTKKYVPNFIYNPNQLDYLISRHFDYRGLIEKGLALEAPEGMYK